MSLCGTDVQSAPGLRKRTEKGTLTFHGSAADSYAPPSSLILSSKRNGTALTALAKFSSTLENPVAFLPEKIDFPDASLALTRALLRK